MTKPSTGSEQAQVPGERATPGEHRGQRRQIRAHEIEDHVAAECCLDIASQDLDDFS